VAGTVAVIELENLTFFQTDYAPDCTSKAMYQKNQWKFFLVWLFTLEGICSAS
jgi:hypothetical protein